MEQNNATVGFMHSQDFRSALNSSIVAMEYTTEEHFEASEDTAARLDDCLLLSADDGDERIFGRSSVYDQAILIPPTMMSNQSVVAPILIFNAALAHNLIAEHDGIPIGHHTRALLLHRAKQLYKLAYDACDEEQNPLFGYVIINNIAVIERETGNISEANECLELLLSLLESFVERGDGAYLRHLQRFAPIFPFPIRAASAA